MMLQHAAKFVAWHLAIASGINWYSFTCLQGPIFFKSTAWSLGCNFVTPGGSRVFVLPQWNWCWRGQPSLCLAFVFALALCHCPCHVARQFGNSRRDVTMPPPLALAFAAFALALAFAVVARVLARAVQVRRRRHPVEITPCHWDVALGGWRRAWFADGRGAFLLRCPGGQKCPRCRIYGTGGWRPWPWPRRARNRARLSHPDDPGASRSTFKCEHCHDLRRRSRSIALVW